MQTYPLFGSRLDSSVININVITNSDVCVCGGGVMPVVMVTKNDPQNMCRRVSGAEKGYCQF